MLRFRRDKVIFFRLLNFICNFFIKNSSPQLCVWRFLFHFIIFSAHSFLSHDVDDVEFNSERHCITFCMNKYFNFSRNGRREKIVDRRNFCLYLRNNTRCAAPFLCSPWSKTIAVNAVRNLERRVSERRY